MRWLGVLTVLVYSLTACGERAETSPIDASTQDDAVSNPERPDVLAVGQPGFELVSTFGSEPQKLPGAFNLPSGIAVDSKTGDVYVSDNLFHRVQRFDADGVYITEWRVPVSLGVGVTVDPLDSTVLLCIPGQNLVVRFTPEGEETARFGPDLSNPDVKLSAPHDATVDPHTGRIYIVNKDSTVSVLERDGAPVRMWSAANKELPEGKALTNYYKSLGIALDPTGKRVYVVNTGAYRVAEFTVDGELVRRWPESSGSEPGQLRWSRGIAVGSDGRVYVADTDNERAQIFDHDGSHIKAFRGLHDGQEIGFHPRAIDINTTTGKVYAAAAYAHRIDRFDAEGTYEISWGKTQPAEDVLNDARGIAVSADDGRRFVTVRRDHVVKRFSPDGEVEARFLANAGELENFDVSWTVQQNHQFPTPIDLAPDGTVWLIRQGYHYPDDPSPAHWVRAYNRDGTFLKGIENDALAGYMMGLSIHPETGNLFITSTRTNNVLQIDQSGVLIRSFGEVEGEEALKIPTGIALDPQAGRIYVADSGKHRIAVYAMDGSPLGGWGETGRAVGQFKFSKPAGLATDACGRVYAADHGNARVQVFSPDGTPLTQLPVRFADGKKKAKPWDVDVVGDRLYIVSHGIGHEYRLTPAGCPAG